MLSEGERSRIKREKREAKLTRRGMRGSKELKELRAERKREEGSEVEGKGETLDNHVEGVVEGTQVAS